MLYISDAAFMHIFNVMFMHALDAEVMHILSDIFMHMLDPTLMHILHDYMWYSCIHYMLYPSTYQTLSYSCGSFDFVLMKGN